MTSSVRLDIKICSHETTVRATDKGDGSVGIEIVSDCKSVQTYAELLRSADTKDLTEWEGSKVLEMAGKAGLTTTCLVPTAVFNCCWVEVGMMSKSLAKEKSPLCIHFVD
ncbi:MAG TPA: hypothetical protein VMS79_00945 [Methanomassiliicoccales archaeon]|nr:hypothetical protein [Methanomassiliicoccales archaeon]